MFEYSSGNEVLPGIYAKSKPYVIQLGRQLRFINFHFRVIVGWEEVPILLLKQVACNYRGEIIDVLLAAALYRPGSSAAIMPGHNSSQDDPTSWAGFDPTRVNERV